MQELPEYERLQKAAFLSSVLLGLSSLADLILTRYRIDHNSGIFAIAADLGFGTVVRVPNHESFYCHYHKLFDGTWIVHILLVELATIVTYLVDRQDVASALGVYGALSQVSPEERNA